MEHGRSASPESLADCQRMIRELKELVKQQQATIEQYHGQLEHATEQITLLKKALFSPRRERFAPDPNQGHLFTPAPLDGAADEQPAQNESEESADDEPPLARDRSLKRRRKRIMFPQFLPRKRRDYPLPPEERPCGHCGADRVVIQERVTEQLEMEPPQAYVVEHVRYTYACPACREGDQVVTTQKPPQAVQKSPFGPSVLAWLVAAKFARHLPAYRHQEILAGPLKLWLSRPLLCGLLRGTAEALRPLDARIRESVLASALLQADETPVRFLGKIVGRAALGYLWAYAGDDQHPYVFYDFQPNRSRDGPEKILPTYKGYLQSDGYAVYTSLVRDSKGRLRDVACWAHGRRGLDEARYTTSHPLLHEALAWIQQLYDTDDRARNLPPGERLAVRRRESAPILERMRRRFLEVRPELRPTSKLAEAIDYLMNRWEGFGRFLEDGRIPLDTNLVERLLRPVAVGRKNFLFFGSQNGGRTAATLYSIVQSARRNNVDVLPYLTDVLRKLPTILPDDVATLDALLPDRWAQLIPSTSSWSGSKNPAKHSPADVTAEPPAAPSPADCRFLYAYATTANELSAPTFRCSEGKQTQSAADWGASMQPRGSDHVAVLPGQLLDTCPGQEKPCRHAQVPRRVGTDHRRRTRTADRRGEWRKKRSADQYLRELLIFPFVDGITLLLDNGVDRVLAENGESL